MMRPRLCFIAAFSGAALLAGGTADAHALLLSSQPAPGQRITGPAVDFVLRYNSRVDAARSRLTLKGGAGKARRLDISPGDSPDALKSKADGLAAGKFTLHWQVLSVDGHISSGDLAFTVAPPVSAR